MPDPLKALHKHLPLLLLDKLLKVAQLVRSKGGALSSESFLYSNPPGVISESSDPEDMGQGFSS